MAATGCGTGVAVGAGIGMEVGVAVGMAVGVGIGVEVAVAVDVAVGTGVGMRVAVASGSTWDGPQAETTSIADKHQVKRRILFIATPAHADLLGNVDFPAAFRDESSSLSPSLPFPQPLLPRYLLDAPISHPEEQGRPPPVLGQKHGRRQARMSPPPTRRYCDSPERCGVLA